MLAVAAAVIVVLTSCEIPGIETGAAQELQGQVAEVTGAAEDGDYQQALQALDELSVRLDTATRAGEVSLSRHERISGAIEAVRLTLETEIALHEDPAPAQGPGDT